MAMMVYRSKGSVLSKIGFLLIIIGIAILFITPILVALSIQHEASSQENVSVGVGGCIIILFIPICFGVGSPGILEFTLVITAVMLIATVLLIIFSKKVLETI